MRKFSTTLCLALAALALGFTLGGALPACDAPGPAGELEQALCGSGLTMCNGVCVNTQTDVNNCGACGIPYDQGPNPDTQPRHICNPTTGFVSVECDDGKCKSVFCRGCTAISGYTACDGYTCIGNSCNASGCSAVSNGSPSWGDCTTLDSCSGTYCVFYVNNKC